MGAPANIDGSSGHPHKPPSMHGMEVTDQLQWWVKARPPCMGGSAALAKVCTHKYVPTECTGTQAACNQLLALS